MQIRNLIIELEKQAQKHGDETEVFISFQQLAEEGWNYIETEKVSFLRDLIEEDSNEDDTPITITVEIYGESLKESE